MSFLADIRRQAEQDAATALAQRTSEAERAAAMRRGIRDQVDQGLQRLADTLGHPLIVLNLGDRYPQYYDIGGLIISVRPYNDLHISEVHPDHPRHVLRDFQLHGIGADRGPTP